MPKHRNAASEYLWSIDPLDGTANFSTGKPLGSNRHAAHFSVIKEEGWIIAIIICVTRRSCGHDSADADMFVRLTIHNCVTKDGKFIPCRLWVILCVHWSFAPCHGRHFSSNEMHAASLSSFVVACISVPSQQSNTKVHLSIRHLPSSHCTQLQPVACCIIEFFNGGSHQRTFTAKRNGGAFVDGQPLRVSRTRELRDALVVSTV